MSRVIITMATSTRAGKLGDMKTMIEKNGRFWRFARNGQGRDFVVADLHGELDALHEAMAEIDFDTERDRLFSVGDLVDRGPASFELLELAAEDWFCPVMGNHDQLTASLGREAGRAFSTGLASADGGPSPVRIGEERRLMAENLDAGWLLEELEHLHRDANPLRTLKILASPETWPLAIEVQTDRGPIGILHANPPDQDWSVVEQWLADPDEATVETIVWGRSLIRRVWEGKPIPPVAGLAHLYTGHTVVGPEPLTVGNQTWIDTGAVFGVGRVTLHRL